MRSNWLNLILDGNSDSAGRIEKHEGLQILYFAVGKNTDERHASVIHTSQFSGLYHVFEEAPSDLDVRFLLYG